jgi:hypothetical protein
VHMCVSLPKFHTNANYEAFMPSMVDGIVQSSAMRVRRDVIWLAGSIAIVELFSFLISCSAPLQLPQPETIIPRTPPPLQIR